MGWVGVEQRDVLGLANSSAGRAVGWSHVFGPTVTADIDVFRVGTRVLFGDALLHDRLWIGVGPGFVLETGWRRATEAALSSGSTSSSTGVNAGSPSAASALAGAFSPSVSGLVQGRFGRRLLVGGELGIERALPNLAWGTSSIFNSFRLQVGLEVGIILGDPI